MLMLKYTALHYKNKHKEKVELSKLIYLINLSFVIIVMG